MKKGQHIPKENLTGRRYGKLTVLEYAGYRISLKGNIYHEWYCQCDCGNRKIITGTNLNSGHAKSCGCISHRPINQYHKHNMTDTPLYNVWKSMKGRCYTPSNTGYIYYGARGIKVCDEWKNDYQAFYEWAMDCGYKPGLSIDRIDVNGDYEPLNCRWTTALKQANNKTDTVYREIDGELLTTREISEKYNIPYGLLKSRLDRGITPHEAIYGEFINGKVLTIDGESKTLTEWSKISGTKLVTISQRLRLGWSPKDAVFKPVDHRKDWRAKS